MRFSLFLAASVLFLPAVAQSGAGACLTTLPPSPTFLPPAPYGMLDAGSGAFWYGTDALWTKLASDGVWHTSDNQGKHNDYRTKLTFWTKGFDWRKEHEPELIVTARRIDGDAPAVAVARASVVFVEGGTPAMMTGIRIPESGCWEITAFYKGHALPFIVSVEP